MHFDIQAPDAGRLLDRIDAISNDAQFGVGVFAFASKQGIQALINSPSIQKLLGTGTFTLIVGVDALTNVQAIETLRDLSETYEGRLQSFVFFDGSGTGIFHPKFCWFKNKGGIRALAGSGNLTSAGLGVKIEGSKHTFNWEAFGDFSLSGKSAAKFEAAWNSWLKSQQHANRLRSLRDQEVMAKAMENSRFRWQKKSGRAPGEGQSVPTPSGASVGAVPAAEESRPAVFISEISKNAPARIQGDFHKEDLELFFGFEIRAGQQGPEVLIQNVKSTNSVGEVEIRRPFPTRSRNFRVELGAGNGVSYTTTEQDDRPVVVFVRVGPSAFRYSLLVDGDQGYREVLDILGPIAVRGRRIMRTAFLEVDEIKRQWSTVPAALLPSGEELPEV